MGGRVRVGRISTLVLEWESARAEGSARWNALSTEVKDAGSTRGVVGLPQPDLGGAPFKEQVSPSFFRIPAKFCTLH
jgi:hypothetical protein